MFSHYKTYFKNYANFNGRSTRPEYFWPLAINLIIASIFTGVAFFWMILGGFLSESGNYDYEAIGGIAIFLSFGTFFFAGIFQLITFLPTLASAVRRLRDAALHPALVLIYYIPYALYILFSWLPVVNILFGFVVFGASIAILIMLAQPTKEKVVVSYVAPQAPVSAPQAAPVAPAAPAEAVVPVAPVAPVVEAAPAENVAPVQEANPAEATPSVESAE